MTLTTPRRTVNDIPTAYVSAPRSGCRVVTPSGWSGGFRALQLLLSLIAVASLAAWVFRYDARSSAMSDPSLADAPVMAAQVFGETREESRLRRLYHEPERQPIAVPSVESKPGVSQPFDGVPPELVSKATKLYGVRCASCHGQAGQGDGAAADYINPKPRSFADPKWQGTVTNDELAAVIVKGGAAVGKSYMMPASPDLRRKQELTDALVRVIRAFSQTP